MITHAYCRTMARYNAWQNDGLRKIVPELADDALRMDRGAFFGSIFETLNHLLWVDLIWMSRFEGTPSPVNDIPGSRRLTKTAADWAAERFRVDARITLWAERLRALDLLDDVTWFSASQNRNVTRSKASCVTHFFNHQTHHRGQVHAMLTAAGASLGDTDLVFMPE